MKESNHLKFQQGYLEAICDNVKNNIWYERGKLLRKGGNFDKIIVKDIKRNYCELEW